MEVTKLLSDHGVRPSLHRAEVLSYLLGVKSHPSVDMIYDALAPRIPTLSRTTIYNIVTLLVEKGLVSSITIDSRQCRYDGDMTSHAHFLCTECGTLYDIPTAPVNLMTDHHVVQTQIYAKGVCQNCKPSN